MTAEATMDAAPDPRVPAAGAAAQALFASTFGASTFGALPTGAWSAPGRVNLIGEHTDYNEGFVLPFAIDRRTHVAAALNGTGRIRVASTFADAPAEAALDDLDVMFPASEARSDAPRVTEWATYPLGVAWALRLAGTAAGAGVDIAIASDVPVGAGLSSSAAIEGAVASALNDLLGAGLGPVALAQIGRRAENEAVGAPTGIMDQMAAMLGRTDAAIFLDCRSLAADIVDLGFSAAGLEIVVIDTRVSHAHSTGGYRERRDACERGAALMGVPALRDVSVGDLERAQQVMDAVTLRRVRHVVTENQRVLDTVRALRAGSPAEIGPLLDASHASMRDDFEISTPELDVAVEAARAAGALGARMTGGGFGGAAIALTPHERIDAVAEAAASAFASAGFAAPHVFTVAPSHGARRDA
ncbi:galactokinase [Microbacterium terrisoli]|uniref:galactokinase n=1 Tax=Microbacterium terrisoli TaxID=3242192 RepID=UPI00280606CD|nr:galactokinase [Microbacterium protaetiae]